MFYAIVKYMGPPRDSLNHPNRELLSYFREIGEHR